MRCSQIIDCRDANVHGAEQTQAEQRSFGIVAIARLQHHAEEIASTPEKEHGQQDVVGCVCLLNEALGKSVRPPWVRYKKRGPEERVKMLPV